VLYVATNITLWCDVILPCPVRRSGDAQAADGGSIRETASTCVGGRVISDAPLNGIVVVEIGHSVAAPFAGLVLGQLGADVIKIERPDGGDHARGWGPPMRNGASGLFHAINREKRSVALELRDPQARADLMSLIVDRADVVIQNLRPNSIEALGLGAAELTRRKPSLIYCNLSAFGGVGPLASRPGYDPLMQTYGGLMSVTGEHGRPAVRVGVSIIDIGTGLWSVIGIQAALLERARTGQGGIIDTSLYETALAWMGVQITEFSATGIEPRRHGSGAAQIVPYEMFATSDGHLMIAVGNDSLFGRLCGALGEPQLAQDERFRTNVARVQNRAELFKLLQATFRVVCTAQWRDRLDKVGVPNAPLRTLSEVMSDPQTLALGILQHVAGLGLTTVGVPIRFNGRRPQLRRSAPQLGEHFAELCGDLPTSSLVSEGHG
jgi:crotonobetainyl-CoA:carnitine CoA-transferase CaiB-like acyl-CoA transferase